ncbi:Holliday junction resolvase RecU [Mycoplasma sp. 332]|uniref:Holliday junction resolvase RecU n=1 Tax=unclassified Asterococcus (in: mycoplasmas, genus) TaxID=3407551 RepID=UPI003F65BC5D
MKANFKNRGMLLETIINQTREFYFKNSICIIHKKNLDITFKSVQLHDKKLKLDNAIISSKSSVDYYGIYKGRFLAFEAKSTESDVLPFNNIKQHQIEYLDLIKKHNGIAFWIIYFKPKNLFLLIEHHILQEKFKTKKALHYEEALCWGKKLSLSFPGILNIVENITF